MKRRADYIENITLKHGDIKELSYLFGVSRHTVRRVLLGESQNSEILAAARTRMRSNAGEKIRRIALVGGADTIIDKSLILRHFGYRTWEQLEIRVYGNRALIECLEKMPNNGMPPPQRHPYAAL